MRTQTWRWGWLAVFVLGLGAPCLAEEAKEEEPTKEECVAKCKEVAAIAKEKGEQAAIDAVMAEDSPFVWKGTYIFIVDVSGDTRAHPSKPKLVGKSLMHLKDVDGVLFMQEFVKTGKEKGEGWIEYKWPKPGEKKPSKKTSYVLREGDLVIGAGIYLE